MDITYRVIIYDPEYRIGKELLKLIGGGFFNIKITESPEQLAAGIQDFEPHLVCLCIQTQDYGPFAFLKIQRSLASHLRAPWLFVLGQADERQEIAAFANGADSVIWLPLAGRALKLRLKALISRSASQHGPQLENTLQLGRLHINKKENLVTWQGEEIGLGKREFDLLMVLVQNPGKLFSRAELLQLIVGGAGRHSPRTIDVHICNLREKFGAKFIGTFKGKGYQLNKAALMSEGT
jgi:two-component system, OmpR family, alkaline phosphatase synthesis response regulator PhoP